MQKQDANVQDTHLQPPVARLDTPPPKSTSLPTPKATFIYDTETGKPLDIDGAFTKLCFPKQLLVYFNIWVEYEEKLYALDATIDIKEQRIKKDAEMWNAWEKGEGHPKMMPTEKAALQGWKNKIDKKEAIGLPEMWLLARNKVFCDSPGSMGYKIVGRKLIKVSKEEQEESDKLEADAEEWEQMKTAREKGEGHPTMTTNEKAAVHESKNNIDNKEDIGLIGTLVLALEKVAVEWPTGYKTDERKLTKVSKEEKKEFDKKVEVDNEEKEEKREAVRGRKRKEKQ